MSLNELKEQVLEANLALQRSGLVLYTFGNVSQIDRAQGLIAIKPSGVSYEKLRAQDIVIIDLDNRVVEGSLRPSSDTKTHLAVYRAFATIGGVAHTHSTFATSWAQARKAIPCYGTTHADYVYGAIPCTRLMTDEQVAKDYEEETGRQIVEAMGGKDPAEVPMILVAGHGPFTWGKDASEAVYHSVILEELAAMAYHTCTLAANPASLQESLLNKHYQRKHGKNAYYGQSETKNRGG